MDTLVRLKLPWQSTQVLPTITLCAVLLGGTRLNTSPVLRSFILDRPAQRHTGMTGGTHGPCRCHRLCTAATSVVSK